MACKICAHENRAEIENALLSISSDNTAVTLEKIADSYKVSLNDLKLHAVMHAPMGFSEQEDSSSIVRKLKLKEADMLSAMVAEYMVTLKTVGRKINLMAAEPDNIMFSKLMTKAIADLYVGVGGEIRATVKTMAELDALLNGPDTATAGLQALAEAIKGSR